MTLTLGSGPLAGRRAGAFNFDIDGAAPKHRIYFAADARRLRALRGEQVVLDTTRAHLLHETGIPPRIYAPLEDYDPSFLIATSTTSHCPFKGDASYWNVADLEDALWAYEDPRPEAAFLAGFGALYEDRFDWLVEDEPVAVHLRDPFHRVDAHRSSREVVVRVGGAEVARVVQPVLLFETGLPPRAYVPRAAVGAEVGPGSGRTGACPYKGTYEYVSVGGVTDAAWTIADPLPGAEGVRGLLSFDDAAGGVEVTIA